MRIGGSDGQDEASIASAIEATVERFGTIDVLVNNAGFGIFGPLEAITGEQLEQQFKVNVFGTAAMKGGLMVAIHALLPDRVWRALLGAGMNRAPKPPHGATATGTA